LYATNNAAMLQKYQSESILTASPMELVVMLYEGLVKQIKLADIFIEQNSFERANQSLNKAQDIVAELLRSLDFHYSIANELMKLYDYMLQELMYINLHKDRERIPDLLEIVVTLKDAWSTARTSADSRAFAIEE